jgi:hypothetical protein
MCSTSCILRFAATLISVIDSEAFFEIQRLFIIFCTSSAISSQDWSLIILAEVELINPLTMAFSIMFVMSCVYCVIYFLHYPEREREYFMELLVGKICFYIGHAACTYT